MKAFFLLILMAGVPTMSTMVKNMKEKETPTIVGEWTDLRSVRHNNFYRAIFYGTGSLIIVRGDVSYDAAYKVKAVSENEIRGEINVNKDKARFTAVFQTDEKILLKVKYNSGEQIHEFTRTKRFDSNFQLLQ